MKHSDFYCKRIFEKVKRAKEYAEFMLRKCENSQKFSVETGVKCDKTIGIEHRMQKMKQKVSKNQLNIVKKKRECYNTKK